MADRAKQAELDAWVVATAPRAVAYAASLLRDRSQAEDVVQECYCRLIQKADEYDLPRDGLKLLYRSITNACINLTTRARPVVSLDGLATADGKPWEAPDRRGEAPDQALLRGELEQVVADSLARLPPLYRAALELKSLGHSQQEIAAALKVAPGYAGVLVHRARQMMATFLAPYVGEVLR